MDYLPEDRSEQPPFDPPDENRAEAWGLTLPAVIQPIPTLYKGYRCRSRLEARWLVFFDCMGIAFEYEPEGFSLPSGNYLPDLLLTHVRMWAEIKPVEFTTHETKLCHELAKATHRPCFYLIGTPDYKAYDAIHSEDGELFILDYSLDSTEKWYATENRFCCNPGGRLTIGSFSPEYQMAVEAARGERFGVYEGVED